MFSLLNHVAYDVMEERTLYLLKPNSLIWHLMPYLFLLSFVFHIDWLQNHCWFSAKSMTPDFGVVVSVKPLICCHIGWGMPYLCIFVKEVVTLSGAITDKWV